MQKRSLADWLAYQEQLHPNTIDLGLDRLKQVLARLQWSRPGCPIVTVGGTNGKGSCVALLESIYSAAGYRVGTFTSPHLIRYNERIRVAGREVLDAELIAAFKRIEAARDGVSLTFFEFNALAALLVFAAENLDLIVLEVGLGGRLDAVNIVDADVAVVASIALDHCEWLGSDVESIAREKAGIFRAGSTAIFGARAMPRAINSEAQRIGARLKVLGSDFDFLSQEKTWEWRGSSTLTNLPPPALFGAVQFDNAATALAVIDDLQRALPIERQAIDTGLRSVRLSGRFQAIRLECNWLLDVAHNPAAATRLAENLAARPCAGRTIAICGMFKDKDIDGVVASVARNIDTWIIAGVSGGRAAPTSQLASTVERNGGIVEHIAVDVVAACLYAQSRVRADDRVVVFGSFYAVGPALEWLEKGTGDRS